MKNTSNLRFKKFIPLMLYTLPFIYYLFNNMSFFDLIKIYVITSFLLILIFRVSLISFIGNLNFAKGNIEKANKYYEIAIKKNTKSPTVYLNYAIYLLQKGEASEALNYLKKALLLNTKIMTDKNILLTMASCYWILGEIDKAIETLENLKNKYDYINANVLTTLGYMYFLKEDYKKAIEFTDKAIEEEPESGAAWDNLGQIYYKTLDLDKSEQAFIKALNFRSNLVDSNYYLASLYEKKGDYEKAKEFFIKAYSCPITALNSVTKEQVEEMYKKYLN